MKKTAALTMNSNPISHPFRILCRMSILLVAATMLSSCSVYERVAADTNDLYVPDGLEAVVLIDAREGSTRAWRLLNATMSEGSLSGSLVELTQADALVARTLPGAQYRNAARNTTRCFLSEHTADMLPHRGYATISMYDVIRIERLGIDKEETSKKTFLAVATITAATATVVVIAAMKSLDKAMSNFRIFPQR
jgi:hypothetical protein